jgi:hypothetical protein
MPNPLPFFVRSIDTVSIEKSFSFIASDNKLESDERMTNLDVICEGSIEGLVDKEGNLLKYITDSNTATVESLVLGKGVYFNDVPLIDDKLNKLNFVTQGFDISYGEEFNYYKNQYASTVHRYNKKIYLNQADFEGAMGINIQQRGFFAAQMVNNVTSMVYDKYYLSQPKISGDTPDSSPAGKSLHIINTLRRASLDTQVFIHKIVNKYCDQLSIHFKADSLFNTTKGNTVIGNISMGILIEEDNSPNTFGAVFVLTGVSKGNYVFNIPINLNLDTVNRNAYYVKIFALTQKVSPLSGDTFKEMSVSSIIERIISKGSFSYPFSSIVRSSVSSNHFNSDPQRSFDLKLLKIKVPKNYDSEIGEYDGNWDGNFDNFLRWTDNPAWILNDICTNSRYGVSAGNISDKDLNKWELYKISKYCDELVPINTPSLYSQDSFVIYDANTILIAKSSSADTLEQFRKKYPSINDSTNANLNGGLHNSIIFLYNLSNDTESIDENFKKIIVSVDEVSLSEDSGGNKVITNVSSGGGGFFRIKLMNDFGPRKFFEKSETVSFLNEFIKSSVGISSLESSNDTLTNKIDKSIKNTQSGAKNSILYWLDYNLTNNVTAVFPKQFVNRPCFSKEILEYDNVKGFCLPKTLNYRDKLEKRFSCNILIDNETEFLKVINDIASVFRGLTYYKNNFITSTIDVEKPVSYLFNNSNVKDGLFSYSSASIDGNYSVAKVMFRDKYLNYDQQVEIVEDSLMVNNYGIVTKEILGFGITSRHQARRIGEWLLATNRFENQTVNFVTDLQGLILKPSDVIQIEDEFKNNSVLQGRVTSINYNDKYITVDRKINLTSTGEIIKFLADVQKKTISSLNEQKSVSDQDIDDLNLGDVIKLRINRIENDTNRIYFDETYEFYNFTKILSSTPFIIENSKSNLGPNLYKVVSISETSNNEYSFFCIKHDKAKYESLSKGSFEKNFTFVDNTISFADSDSLKEVDLSGMNSSYYEIAPYSLNEINGLTVDFNFNEQQSSLVYSSSPQRDYYVLNLKISNIFNFIDDKRQNGTIDEKKYYGYIQEVFNKKGGLLFKVVLRNQSLKFKIQNSNISDKRIFLGKFSTNNKIVSAVSGIRIYLFDVNNKIIEV